MSKDYTPKNFDNIGDPIRTEETIGDITGGGRWRTFKQDDETFQKMYERRNEEGETKKGKWVEMINREIKQQEQNPTPSKEVKEKAPTQSKTPDKDAKDSR